MTAIPSFTQLWLVRNFIIFSQFWISTKPYFIPRVPEDPSLYEDDSHLFPVYPFQQYIQVRRSDR